MSKRKIDETMTEARAARKARGHKATEAETPAAETVPDQAPETEAMPGRKPTVAEWMAAEDATEAAGAATPAAADAQPEPAATGAHAGPEAPTDAPTTGGTQDVSPHERDTAMKAEREAAKAAKKAAREQAKIDRAAAREDLVVFAIRLTASERDAIHGAAGPGKATRFVRTLAVAAARGDLDAIHQLVAERQA